jgi:large subunit ribosomal protein L29
MAGNAVHEMDDAALVRDLVQKQQALVRARFQKSAARLENTASLGDLRKGIARLRTEIRRRELAQGLAKDALLGRNAVDPRTLEKGEAGAAAGGFLAGVVDKLSG